SPLQTFVLTPLHLSGQWRQRILTRTCSLSAYHAAMVQKEFVVNFITSYMPLSFTAFVYTPFGHILRPYLDVWASLARMLTPSSESLSGETKAQDMFGGAEDFRVNSARIANQMFYWTVT